MNVIIEGMQLPDKCCKCPILRRVNGMCQLIERRIVDPGKRHEACPLKEAADD